MSEAKRGRETSKDRSLGLIAKAVQRPRRTGHKNARKTNRLSKRPNENPKDFSRISQISLAFTTKVVNNTTVVINEELADECEAPIVQR